MSPGLAQFAILCTMPDIARLGVPEGRLKKVKGATSGNEWATEKNPEARSIPSAPPVQGFLQPGP